MQRIVNEKVLIRRGIGRWDREGSTNDLLDDDDRIEKELRVVRSRGHRMQVFDISSIA